MVQFNARKKILVAKYILVTHLGLQLEKLAFAIFMLP